MEKRHVSISSASEIVKIQTEKSNKTKETTNVNKDTEKKKEHLAIDNNAINVITTAKKAQNYNINEKKIKK